jgi:hypothetical protein
MRAVTGTRPDRAASDDMPATPTRVWQAIQSARTTADSL